MFDVSLKVCWRHESYQSVFYLEPIWRLMVDIKRFNFHFIVPICQITAMKQNWKIFFIVFGYWCCANDQKWGMPLWDFFLFGHCLNRYLIPLQSVGGINLGTYPARIKHYQPKQDRILKKSLRSARRGWLHRFSLPEISDQLPIGYCFYSLLPPVPHSIHVLLEAILVLIPEQMLEIYLLSIDACVAYKVYMVFRAMWSVRDRWK